MKHHFLFLESHKATQATVVTLDKKNISSPARRIALTNFDDWSESDKFYIVLADQMVSNYQLEISIRKQSQLIKAARYAIEEKIPGHLEDYHIVTQKGSRRGVSVRAIKLKRLEKLIKHLANFNIRPNFLFVESDLLNSNLTTLLFGEQQATLCGEKLDQTYEFDNSLIPVIGERIFSAVGTSQELQVIYSDNQELVVEALVNQAPENIRVKKVLKNERYYEALCQNKNSAINLLKGEFSVNGDENSEQSYWKFPFWLVVTSIAIFSGSSLAQNIILKNNTLQQEQELLSNYTNVFKNSAKPRDAVDLANKLKSKLKQANLVAQKKIPIDAIELLNFTALVSQEFPIQIIGLTIDTNSAEVLISGASVELLDNFKNKMSSELKNNTLTMDTVTSKDDIYQGKISIR